MHSLEAYLTSSVAMRKHMSADLPAGYDYRCFEDFVLQRGTLFESTALTEEEEAIVREALATTSNFGIDVHEMKQCFANAQQFVLFSGEPRLVYYEGYALSRIGFPIHHGWVGINGKVVDLTWELECPVQSRSLLPSHPVGELPEPLAYWGFACKSVQYIRFRIMTREVIGSLLDDWEGRYPFLRGIDPNDEESWRAFAEEVREAS